MLRIFHSVRMVAGRTSRTSDNVVWSSSACGGEVCRLGLHHVIPVSFTKYHDNIGLQFAKLHTLNALKAKPRWMSTQSEFHQMFV